MRTIVTAHSPAEFLSLVPSLCGFTPRSSLVMIGFRRGQTHGVFRADLPAHDHDLAAYAAMVLGVVCRLAEVDAAAAIVYTDEVLGLYGPLPQADLVTQVHAGLERCGFALFEALCLGPDGWARYEGKGGQRHPLSSIPDAPRMPGIGDVSGHHDQRGTLPDIDPETRAARQQAFASLSATAGEGAMPTSLAGHETPADVPGFLEHVIGDRSDPDPDSFATLAWLLNEPLFRDAALVQWARDESFGRMALEAQLRFRKRGTPVPEALGKVLSGRGARPDPDRLSLALNRVQVLAASLEGTARVGPLVAASWLAWAQGQGSQAGDYIDQALAISPRHSMAKILGTMFDAGGLPEWVFTRSAD